MSAATIAAGRPSVPDRPTAAAAELAALDGRSVEAARLADAVLADPTGGAAEQARAADVLAVVVARRGMLAQAAELHLWAARTAPGTASPAAAIALVGTGTVGATGPVTTSAAPTLRSGADGLVARAVHAAVRPGGSAAALSDLTRAAATLECRGVPVLQDDSPAALGALVALHRGEADLAASLLDRALAAELGGPGLRRRHLLLRAWAAMTDGDVAAARDGLAAAHALGDPVDARDELVAVALEAGLARRVGDTRALLALWGRAREAVLRHAVDLWSLLPIGELLVVAARLGEGAWLAPHATDADELLTALGRPALWAAPWHWSGFLAAVVAEDPPGATAHAGRLRDAAADAAPGDCLAPVLARATGCWLDVLAGAVDADAVTAVATSLREVGMGFDAARLAKEAAVRTADRRTLAAMLNLARAVLPASGPATTADVPAHGPAGSPVDSAPAVPADPTAVSATPVTRAAAPAGPRRSRPPLLSDREREVAVLLLEGMTYRQIGDRLFITAKTVEHHVGRMRQRLGSESRTDLFADLRAALG